MHPIGLDRRHIHQCTPKFSIAGAQSGDCEPTSKPDAPGGLSVAAGGAPVACDACTQYENMSDGRPHDAADLWTSDDSGGPPKT